MASNRSVSPLMRWRFRVACVRRLFRCAESLPEVSAEREEEDVLDRYGKALVPIQLSATLGLADVNPVRRAVAGASEARLFDKGLEQDGRVAVATVPVLREPSGEARQQMGGQVGGMNPGQDQEARVVDHLMQVVAALLQGPANEQVAGRDLPRRGAKADRRANWTKISLSVPSPRVMR